MSRLPFPFLFLLPFLLLACPAGDDDDDTAADDDTATDDDTTGPGPAEAPAMSVTHEPLALTELAEEAVTMVPDWLQDDLAIALDRLSDTDQDDLAMLIVDESDPYLYDEIGFGIAHTSPEVLQYARFHPELFTLNAELIYAYDPDLDFVELLDVGEPGVDADYYTTTTYRIEDESGTVLEKTLDPYYYYWYVVHPRLEDELPLYIDGWASGDGTDPGSGWLWRDFLWQAAEEECPADKTCYLLKDYFDGVDTVWKSKAETRTDNGAIGEIIQFVWDTIDFGAGDERPVQPNRIYVVERGNCGEHADLSSAAARTVLIPCRNVGARSNDHTWDEFWDDRWIAWEPIGTHVDYFNYYKGGVGRDREDDDCDGIADDALDTSDNDGDGYSPATFDCDDNDADVYPGADELHNGYDDDCDGIADPGMSDADLDADGDGFGISGGDCDDTNAAAYPGALETMNSIDDDCDGVADDGLDTGDADGDGWTIAAGDCDDTDASVNPAQPETGNARDDDCDGVADEGFLDATHDYDGDGYSMADGDCNDLDAAIHPGATEIENLRDDDCDGVADTGVDMSDNDGDGIEIIFGDCDDTDPAIHPEAAEWPNGVDDDCDGVADDGLRGHDRDGDGWTLEEGDCDDLDGGRNPNAQDPSLSSNRLYAMTAARGDTHITTDLTENYVTQPSYLEFEITDGDGRPVDGAVVYIYGTWAVYGYDDSWAWAAEVVTDLDGHAESIVGEYNPYGYAVFSSIGDAPGGQSLYSGVEMTAPFETYEISRSIGSATMPAVPDVTVAGPSGDTAPGMTLSLSFEVESYRIDVDGSYYGSMSVEQDGGRLDAFVVDAGNYDLYKDGDPFEAALAVAGAGSAVEAVDLPQGKDWALLLSNKGVLSSTMVGTATVSVAPCCGTTWEDDPDPLEIRFRIPPGEYLTVVLDD